MVKSKIVVGLCMFILLVSIAYSDTLKENYLPNTGDMSAQVGICNSRVYCQAWNTTSTYNLSQVQHAFKTQSGSGYTITHTIYETGSIATLPGTTLYTAVYTEGTNFSSFPTGSFRYENLTIDPVIELTDGLSYMSCIETNQACPNGLHGYVNNTDAFQVGGEIYKDGAWNSGYYLSRDIAFGAYTTDSVGGDTDPPVFSNYLQDPSNATLFNVATNVYMNVTITDASTVTEVNLTHTTNGNVYVNGTLLDQDTIHTALSNDSNVYRFVLDETDFLAGTYNFDPETMEDTAHSYFELKGLNKYLSMQFLNVSNTTELNFFEIMDENATGNAEYAQYWYCNDGYGFDGNVVSDPNCVLFASVLNTVGFNHSHGQSKHRIIPLGVDVGTGSVNGISITPVSYILKRGTQFGDNVYYISDRSREGAFYTTTNNGLSWSEWTLGTVNAHLHQIAEGTALNYIYSACDSEGNCAYSTEQYDVIEFGNIAPNSVEIYSPEFLGYYNTTLFINHSTSNSPSGATLSYYAYDFRESYDSVWDPLGNNTIGTEYGTFDISSYADGGYVLRVRVYDDNGLYSESFQTITIQNPPTIPEAIESLEESINEVFGNMNDTFNMFSIVLLDLVLTGMSIWLLSRLQYIPAIATLILSWSTDIYLLGYWYARIVTENLALGSGFLQNFNTVFLVVFSLIIIWKPIMLFSLKKVRL